MTAAEFVSLATELIYLAILGVVIARAVRLRTTPSIEIAVFFGLIVFALQFDRIAEPLGIADGPVPGTVTFLAIATLPYLLLRLTDHLVPQRRWRMLSATAVTALVVAVGLATAGARPDVTFVLPVGWFALLGGYASFVFIREARKGRGVTGRRLLAAGTGSILVAVALVVALLGLLAPVAQPATSVLVQLLIMASGVAYYAGFATPTWLRRAWQEPSIRSFMGHAAELTRMPDDREVILRLQALAAEVAGTSTALIGIPSDDGSRLTYVTPDGEELTYRADEYVGGLAYTRNRTIFSRNAARDDPEHAAEYESSGARTVMAAPMRIGERSYGVLALYASRTPLLAVSDLELATVLAEQAASILESRVLLREAAELQAREAATRAKEDFLSAAAHDLRTPLSSMMLRVELVKRRLEQEGAEAHATALAAIHRDAQRVSEFVGDLLDAAQADGGALSGVREPVDLMELARDVGSQRVGSPHRLIVDGRPIVVQADGRRLRQVFENLVGNAVKYSPDGGDVRITVHGDDGRAVVAVSDSGIGVPSADLPRLFDRFSRGRNVDDRRYSGLGLGLYICRRIVEEHDGRIWADSREGAGTTIGFEIPLSSEPQHTGEQNG